MIGSIAADTLASRMPPWQVNLSAGSGHHCGRQTLNLNSTGLQGHATSDVVYTWPTWYALEMSELPSESVRGVRSHLADVVDRADRDDQATVITRRGKPVAAVVPIEVLRKYQEWEEREINRIVDERMPSRSAAIPMEDVIQETLARSE
jgi:prevent-host-death family protein